MKLQVMFDRPSMRFDEGLPVGNGRLGAVIGGGLQEKHVYLNEETLWYGGPRDRNNPDALRYMGEIRGLLRAHLTPRADGDVVIATQGAGWALRSAEGDVAAEREGQDLRAPAQRELLRAGAEEGVG